MLFFLLHKKWKRFFSINQNLSSLISNFALLIIFSVAAIVIGKIYNIIQVENINITQQFILKIIINGLLILPTIFKFFPSIALRTSILQKYYPITDFKMALIELAYFVFSKTWIFIMLMFIAIFCVTVNQINFNGILELLFSGVLGILFAENIINCFYYNTKSQFIITFFGLIFCFFIPNLFLLFTYSIAIIFLIVLFVYSYKKNGRKIIVNDGTIRITVKQNFLESLLSNRQHLSVTVFATIIQFFFTILFLKYINDQLPTLKFYMLTPIMLFSYCYNNMWGFYHTTIINLLISGNNIKDFIKIYIRLIMLPLIINLFIVIGIIIFQNYFSWQVIIGVMVLSLFAIANGILFSFIKMKHISKAISFDGNNFNTNLIPTYIIGILSLGLSISTYSNIIFMLYILFILTLSVILFLVVIFKSEYFLSVLMKRYLDKA